MRPAVKKLVRGTLKRFGIGITRYRYLQQFERSSRAAEDIELLLELPDEHKVRLMRMLSHSKSQLRQDLFVLSELDFKRDGFFVEIGAASGVDLSNTFLLEKEFGWRGIVAEPAKRWHKELMANRSCHIETNCIWRESNLTLVFNEVDSAEFSTVDSFNASDHYGKVRKYGKTYEVKTISLQDLLGKYNAPKNIDYLSIDTEGSEYEILSKLDFDKYQFKIITCEHNFAQQRERILSLLTENGYVRKFEGVSRVDDWYVKPELT
jgi:FkbM family methyltransferase